MQKIKAVFEIYLLTASGEGQKQVFKKFGTAFLKEDGSMSVIPNSTPGLMENTNSPEPKEEGN